jgi:hypothetical protein
MLDVASSARNYMVEWEETLSRLSLSGTVPDFGNDGIDVSCEIVGEELDRRFAIREDDEEIAEFWEREELEVNEDSDMA